MCLPVHHWSISRAKMSDEFFPYPFKLDMQHIIKSVTELSLSLAMKCINLCNEKYTFLKTEFLEYRHRIHRVKKFFLMGLWQ